MKIHPLIVVMPDDRLTTVCEDVDLSALDENRALLDKVSGVMIRICDEVTAAGLAAPQIGLPIRLVVLTLRDRDPVVCLNPSYAAVGDNPVKTTQREDDPNEDYYERCFSTPYVSVKVPRWSPVALTYHDLEGRRVISTYSGWDARVVQHEIDHLDGHTLFERLNEPMQERYLRRTAFLRRRQPERYAKAASRLLGR